jgi:hypothetical protein
MQMGRGNERKTNIKLTPQTRDQPRKQGTFIGMVTGRKEGRKRKSKVMKEMKEGKGVKAKSASTPQRSKDRKEKHEHPQQEEEDVAARALVDGAAKLGGLRRRWGLLLASLVFDRALP